MKKNLLITASLLFGAVVSNAQITLTTADVAAPIKVIYQANDTLPSPTLSVGTSGISQTWNMSMLGTSTYDTLTFVSAAWGPEAASFPSANLAVKQGWQDFYAYAVSNSSTLSIVGAGGTADFGGGPVNVKQYNSPAEILMNFPATYLNGFTNNYVSTTPAINPGIAGVDSARVKSDIKKTVSIDAWGSLTTPLGTFNVLRTMETVVRYDTTDIYAFGLWNPFPGTPLIAADSTTGYTWWANGVGFPLVTIRLDSLGGKKEVTWLMALPAVGVNEYTAIADVNVYPNPAQNEITFSLESSVATIQLFDIAGRVIDNVAVSGTIVSVNTSAYANGVYSYALVGKDNAILNRGKFTIAK